MSDKLRKAASGKGAPEVDLVPMMNLLSILIPVLLISTEYIKVVNIPVSSPQIGPSTPNENVTPPTEVPLNLTIAITSIGFYVVAQGQNVAPDGGAVAEGQGNTPTVGKTAVTTYYGRRGTGPEEVLLQVWDYEGKKYVRGSQGIEEERLTMLVEGLRNSRDITGLRVATEQEYDYPRLNHILEDIKSRFPAEDKVTVNGEPNTPFTALIRVMDCARSRLVRQTLTDAEREDFAADAENGARRRKERMDELRRQDALFPKVVLSAGIG